MKLLFFISSMRGGGAEHIMSVLCNNLVRRENEVYLVTDTRIAFAYEIDSRVNILSLYPSNYENRFFLFRFFNLCNVIRYHVKKISPDIVVTFMFGLNAKVILATLGLHIPVVASARSTYHQKMTVVEHIMRYNIHRLASVVTLLTRYDYEYVGKRIPNKKIIPNPLLYPIFRQKANREKVVIAIGSLDRYKEKGFDELIKLWARMGYSYSKWRLEIVGTGTLENVNYLKHLACEYGVENSVRFLGFQKRVDLILQRSAVFILTSNVEGFPNVLVEAMSQGCSCISFDCVTGPSEILTDGKSGLLIQNQNWEEMENKLCILLSDQSLREKLAGNALNAVECYLPDKIIELWEDLFSQLVSERKNRNVII